MSLREPAEQLCFVGYLVVGRLLRSARYSSVRIVHLNGEREVRKRRRFYAPLLIATSGPLASMLDTGVRVLAQREWERREKELYARVHGASIRLDADGTLVLPFLAGETLATLLENPALDHSERTRAIELAVVALSDFHARGFTHADAMAENAMVDLEAGVARWLDFETMHDPGRPMVWRRADDVRALLATCLIRTAPEKRHETIRLILDVYADPEVARLLAAYFDSTVRRGLAFHLGQAAMSFRQFRETARLLGEYLGD